MNWEQVEGTWKRFKNNVKEKCLDVIEGKKEKLAGKFQGRYGITHEKTDKQSHHFLKTS